ncbi:MAG: glycoside hydrolase family 127 protein [Clostridia bacterium]|nr:glycoside hydrolase family 127 protein [Clostridia bacterium]
MKGSKAKKRLLFVLCTALSACTLLGTFTACGGNNGGNEVNENTYNGQQSQIKDAKAVSFTDIGDVKIDDAYAVNGMQKEVEYLLKLNEDKLLYYFYKNAKLEAFESSAYGGGWEGALIGGHTLGHYLTALAQAYANANTSATDKTALLAKMNYIVSALKDCQDNAVTAGAKEGFIWGAAPAGANRNNPEAQFDFVEKGRANIVSEAWVPWYTMHKIIAGLLDVTVYTEGTVSETAKTVVTALGDWVYNRVSGWSASTQRTVLGIEYGGMNDCMYNLYALTGEEKYAVAAHKFDEDTLFSFVRSAPENYLNGLHANTTIPKIIGALNRYVTCNGKQIEGNTVDAEIYLEAAEDFWQYVIDHHTYVTGGNSEWEHFGMDDVLDKERTNANCETCNTYNMLKLSRTLFTITGDKKYLDYYENTYYNAIWSSQNPETGMTTYFQPMATGYFKVYSSEENHFWCCTGSGMESFSKLGDSIYYDAGNATYVSLYLSSEYTGENVSLKQTADLEHSDSVKIEVTAGETVLRLRRPYWSESFGVTLNGNAVTITGKEAFVSVDVKEGDTVNVALKKTARAYGLPDGTDAYALMYGPFVLSAELGTDDMTTTTTGVNVSIPARAIGNTTYSVAAKDLDSYMAEINEHLQVGENGKFTLACGNGTLTYSYHFRQYTQRYGIYMKFALGEVTEEKPEFEWTRQDTVQPGYGQYENDALHNMQETNTVGATNIADVGTYRYAEANGSFTYRFIVNKTERNRIVLTLLKEDNGKTLLIKTGDTVLLSKTLSYSGSEKSYTLTVDIPAAVAATAQSVTYQDASGADVNAVVLPITFGGVNNAESARVCSYIYSEYLINHVAYFVDCGDYNVNTVSEGDVLGKYQSVTEQVYGADAVTGKLWGIYDTHKTNIAGACLSGVGTNSTWAYEFGAGDGQDKTASNRYTKNQFESGVARNLHYKFELANGTYTVKVYFADPWSCSKNPNVSANGVSKISGAAVGEEVSFEVKVTNGELTLDFTSSDKCINLCYIKIIEG